MAPKRLAHKCGNFEISSNGFSMVDYPTNNPNDDSWRHSFENEAFKSDYPICQFALTYLAVSLVGYGSILTNHPGIPGLYKGLVSMWFTSL